MPQPPTRNTQEETTTTGHPKRADHSPLASGRTKIARNANTGQVVLVLQGGGALGAYQAGVYEALHEAGIEPDWVIGTSIGAINAALIAGNEPADRLPKLQEFWARVERASIWGAIRCASGPASPTRCRPGRR